ncbi:MAG: winged helix-turn-helix domain-containing protein, partial [Litoreibacter sp.]|nr:winged helix-turn-helix domain-containing protein [Litoreibacter sp.]
HEARAWCEAACATGAIVPVEVESADGPRRRCLARPDIIAQAADNTAPSERVRILSPFDPALRDRKRAERLFGFSYRIEIFVPEPKRRYGYYVFPVFEGDRPIGRIDMKCLRAETCLKVRAFWPEVHIEVGKGRVQRLTTELERMARFAGASDIAFEKDWLRESHPDPK